MMLIVTPTILYFPMNFLAAAFYSKWKFHHCIMLGAFLQLVGGWVRVAGFFGSEMFSPLLLGTFIFFSANPMILNGISVVANMWFAEDERASATALAGLMAPLGSLFGLGLAGGVAAGMDTEDPVQCMDRLKKIVYI